MKPIIERHETKKEEVYFINNRKEKDSADDGSPEVDERNTHRKIKLTVIESRPSEAELGN